jgi:hypothetical protein
MTTIAEYFCRIKHFTQQAENEPEPIHAAGAVYNIIHEANLLIDLILKNEGEKEEVNRA